MKKLIRKWLRIEFENFFFFQSPTATCMCRVANIRLPFDFFFFFIHFKLLKVEIKRFEKFSRLALSCSNVFQCHQDQDQGLLLFLNKFNQFYEENETILQNLGL